MDGSLCRWLHTPVFPHTGGLQSQSADLAPALLSFALIALRLQAAPAHGAPPLPSYLLLQVPACSCRVEPDQGKNLGNESFMLSACAYNAAAMIVPPSLP